jgi:hypothetical protein
MAKKSVTAMPPTEALPEGESNRYVAKFKASLCKRWSITRMETLFEIFNLAAFLWALDRDKEALAIAATVADAIPAPPLAGRGVNYNLWCPATWSHALLVHLSPRSWSARAEASRTALLGDCGMSRHNPDHIADALAEAGREAAAAAAERSMKWECHNLARALGHVVLFAELAHAGDPRFTVHGKDAGALIPQIIAKLRTTLQSAK